MHNNADTMLSITLQYIATQYYYLLCNAMQTMQCNQIYCNKVEYIAEQSNELRLVCLITSRIVSLPHFRNNLSVFISVSLYPSAIIQLFLFSVF